MTKKSQWHQASYQPEAPPGPLEGIRVLDLSRLVAGNMATLQFADFGADVIKVEPLPKGDPLRAWKQAGQPSFWKAYARNKRSLGVDFRAEGAIALLRRLLSTADVLVENFRPGTLERMGLAPELLLEDNPRLIVLRVSGFGQTGPYSPRPGFGTLVEAMSGFAHRNGEAGSGPLLPPLALADMISGLYGSNAVLMALQARDKTGRGQIIDLALLDSMVSVLGPEPLDYALTGEAKPRVGNGSNTSCPRNVYRSSDGHYIAISASIQSTATRLFAAIGRADMNEDPRYATNEARVAHKPEVDAILSEWIGSRSRDEVMEIAQREGITAAPLYSIEDIVEDDHFRDREIFVDLPDEDLGQATMHSPVPRLSVTPGGFRMPAPRLGEHSEAILEEAGLGAEDIKDLQTAGVVPEHQP
ncbi:CoA transferase [Roseibacterium beibuensis]|uniref:CoA transferase n=1 Tax=[Roseibacterium] beibuensis TaxID=1193142 RepID=A0ABP9KR30_9RHOB|nr:CoA transferase [Roseibacterium beibuensis]MCS6622523.1 CoA transferase [Roseibacterium beibuensis]